MHGAVLFSITLRQDVLNFGNHAKVKEDCHRDLFQILYTSNQQPVIKDFLYICVHMSLWSFWCGMHRRLCQTPSELFFSQPICNVKQQSVLAVREITLGGCLAQEVNSLESYCGFNCYFSVHEAKMLNYSIYVMCQFKMQVFESKHITLLTELELSQIVQITELLLAWPTEYLYRLPLHSKKLCPLAHTHIVCWSEQSEVV